jgi:hypothetical protein
LPPLGVFRCLRFSVLARMLCSTSLLAGPKDCEQLQQEIEVKIQAAGVSSYTLAIVSNAQARDPGMLVGSCANGRRKFFIRRITKHCQGS